MQAILEKIKDLCTKQKISIKNLAEKSGITEQGFYKMFKTNSLKYSVLVEFAQNLDVSVSYLIGESEDQKTFKPTGKLPTESEKEINFLKEKIQLLEKQLSDKEKIIELLERRE